MIYQRFLKQALALYLSVFSLSAVATEFEVSAFLGQMYSSDLTGISTEDALSVDAGGNVGVAVAWQDSPNGQGQIMLNVVSHDFKSEATEQNYSLDIMYAHFNGVAQFRQQSYVTTVSLGLGGAYFDSNISEELYPSATLAFGTRYEFSETVAMITELRGYATLVDADDNMFCENDICHAQFENSLWMESNISIGLAIKF
ncbi:MULTISPECIES: hypothetical protein [Thalassotalea]|uniref:Outer membrane protein beta-barrel domain-containing protein n=1 Tax=Thalassotalea castellviae TaxID=3075612 RepID=A0ABU2ZYK3_9GAMM|nr:hypothetical protein [Thalassotalea sp. W431]MDT0602992.1 hypothetical protein [Thalassotalea sp. W431]